MLVAVELSLRYLLLRLAYLVSQEHLVPSKSARAQMVPTWPGSRPLSPLERLLNTLCTWPFRAARQLKQKPLLQPNWPLCVFTVGLALPAWCSPPASQTPTSTTPPSRQSSFVSLPATRRATDLPLKFDGYKNLAKMLHQQSQRPKDQEPLLILRLLVQRRQGRTSEFAQRETTPSQSLVLFYSLSFLSGRLPFTSPPRHPNVVLHPHVSDQNCSGGRTTVWSQDESRSERSFCR